MTRCAINYRCFPALYHPFFFGFMVYGTSMLVTKCLLL